MLAIFLELNSKGPCQSSRREQEICCPVFPSSTKTKAKNSVQKSVKARAESCCFANLNLLLFSRQSLSCRRLSPLILVKLCTVFKTKVRPKTIPRSAAHIHEGHKRSAPPESKAMNSVLLPINKP